MAFNQTGRYGTFIIGREMFSSDLVVRDEKTGVEVKVTTQNEAHRLATRLANAGVYLFKLNQGEVCEAVDPRLLKVEA